MRLHNLLVLALLVVLVGCATSPAEEMDDTVSSGGRGGSGGNGGAGGSGGSAGAGGEGGSPPAAFVFNCSDVPANRFTKKARSPFDALGTLGVDGSILCPSNSGCTSFDWVGLHTESDSASKTTAMMLVGEFPLGVRVETNWGFSLDGTIRAGSPNYTPDPVPESSDDANPHVVDTQACGNSTCSIDILCCYGSKELGRIEAGIVHGNFAFASSQFSAGVNPVCVTE